MTYESQCVAAVQQLSGEITRCKRDSSNTTKDYLTLIPICSWHQDKARRQFASRLEDEIKDLKESAAKHECDGLRAVEAHEDEQFEHQQARAERMRKASRVYYMRCGKFIKIGVSTSPAGRLRTIREIGGVLAPKGLDLTRTKLVVAEPGDHVHERAMHAKFSHLRHTGEWFTETPELTAHINAIIPAP